MKFLTALSLILMVALHWADLAVPNSLLDQNTQRPTTLFSLPPSLAAGESLAFELWETSIYQIAGQETQVRWSRNGAFVSAAKSCTIGGETVVAQVTMNLEQPRVQYSAVETVNGHCEITLAPSDDNRFFIQDNHLVFSGDNVDGTLEISVLEDEQSTSDALFRKISG